MVNKFLFAGDKLTPDMSLRMHGLHIVLVDHLL